MVSPIKNKNKLSLFPSIRTLFLFLLLLLFISLPYNTPAQTTQEVKIAIPAKRGTERTLQKWSPTIDYHVTVVSLGFADIHATVREAQSDLLFANPNFYVELENLYGAMHIVPFINCHLPDQQTTTFDAVISLLAG